MINILLENAKGLIPNKEHKNFTETRTIYPQGSTIDGEMVEVKGLRKGEPFTYKLFKINNINQYLYSKQVKPITNMENTEVRLGADAQVTPTKVAVPTNEKNTMPLVIGAVIGTGAGFAYAKYKKIEGNTRYVYMAVGALAGFFVTRMVLKNRKVVIKASK
jgi:hypothetical protein